MTHRREDRATVRRSLPRVHRSVGTARYTADDSKLSVVHEDGKGFVWPVTLRAWEAHACAIAGRNFTHEEWSRFVGSRSYSRVCPGYPTG